MNFTGKNIRILIATNRLTFYGVTRYVKLLANALVEEGNEVFVVSAGYSSSSVKVLHEKINQRLISSIPENSRSGIAKTAEAIEEICLSQKIDLVHCNTPTSLKAAAIARSRTKVPVVFTVHSEPMCGIPIVGLEIDKLADKVIAVSEFIKQHLIKTGLISNKVKLIYLGIDTNKFNEGLKDLNVKKSLGIKKAERVVMCVSSLDPSKGIRYLIQAVPEILERGNNIKVVFVGDGGHRVEYEGLAKNLGIKNKVLFLGAKDNVEELLSIADIFCLPSVSEALSFSILEAMAEGKPVIATNVGGIPEAVVDKVTGLLVPPRNVRELALAINSLLEDSNLAERLGLNAKNRIKEKFTFSQMFNETVAAYKEVLEKQEVFA